MALEKWEFDVAHSSVGFWIRHLMISKVHGRFTRWSGWVELDEQNPSASRAEAQIDVTSIDTHQEQRDAHLRSADFFEAEKHPHITFKSTKVEPAGKGEFKVTGELSIRGVTKPVTLEVEYAGRSKTPQFGERAGFTVKTSIDRKDFGVIWNQNLDAGGLALGDKVEIQIELEATRKA